MRGEEESCYLLGTEFQFGKMKENTGVDGGDGYTTMQMRLVPRTVH